MTDYRLNAEPGQYDLTGSPLGGTVKRSAETWQFFAFVFAAAVTLALALLEEMPKECAWCTWWRLAAKAVAFCGLAYLTLVNVRVRGWLVSLLGLFKEERR